MNAQLLVAQISDLLYRGYPTRRPWERPDALPNGIRRYRRPDICATKDG